MSRRAVLRAMVAAAPLVAGGVALGRSRFRRTSQLGPSGASAHQGGPAQSLPAATPRRAFLASQPLKTVRADVLDIAYLDVGPAEGPPVILLHGFPYDVHAYDEAAEQLSAVGKRCIIPYLRGYGGTRFHSADTFRSGQQAALGSDLLALMDALALPQTLLGGYDWGGRAACVVAALHPERVKGLVSCGTPYNVQDDAKATTPVAPEQEHRYWYWYYLNSERGQHALEQARHHLIRYLWQNFSPPWHFDDATFERSALAFDNPDFVAVVLHSYRFRIGEVPGDPTLEALERRITAQPPITVPTIALMGQDDGPDPPKPQASFEPHFTQLRRVQTLPGVGHNLPQEAPDAFVRAVLEVGSA